MKRNADRLKAVLLAIVADRRSGKVPGQVDLMSILVGNEWHKGKDEQILNEMLTFIHRPMKTVQCTLANFIMYMETNPSVKAKLLAEILPVMATVSDDIVEKFTYEMAFDFDYLQHCLFETLRIEPPIQLSLSECFTEQVTFKNGQVF